MIFKDELKTELPCGVLRTQGMVYWLLCPHPVPGDSWEGDNCYRFLVVPRGTRHEEEIHPPARHLVTNSFAVEYMSNIPAIQRRVLVQYDIDVLEHPQMGQQINFKTEGRPNPNLYLEQMPEMEAIND